MYKKIILLTLCTFFFNSTATLYAAPSQNYYKNKGGAVYICKATNVKKEIFEVFFQTGNYHELNSFPYELNLSTTKHSKIYVYKNKKLYFVYDKVIELSDGAGNNTYLVFMLGLFDSLKVVDLHIDHEVPEDTVGELLIPNLDLNSKLKLMDKLQIYSNSCD